LYFICMMEKCEQLFAKIDRIKSTQHIDEGLRGYNEATWIHSDQLGVTISVSDLTFDVCPTNRNIYLSKIMGVRLPGNADRVKGRAIESLCFRIHNEIRSYLGEMSKQDKLRMIDSLGYLRSKEGELVQWAFDEGKRKSGVADNALINEADLKGGLLKILRFESLMVSSLLNYRIARMSDHRLLEFYDGMMHFTFEPSYQADFLGLGEPITPDFLYAGKAIGDIKSGKWEEYMNINFTAYALAYEHENTAPLDVGLIYHVSLEDSCSVPVHWNTQITYIDNTLRAAFLSKRDKKLAILLSRTDPGRAERTVCATNHCPFILTCWDGGVH